MSRRAAFLLPDMGGGGAERLTLDLMAGFLARGAEVDLVLQGKSGAFLPLVPEGVRIVDLGAPRLRHVPLALRGYLRRERPDALLAAMWPLTVMAILAARLARSPARVVVADHSSLGAQYGQDRLAYAALRLTIRLYRRADRIVGVSQGVANELAALAGLKRDTVHVVYNPVPPPLTSPGKHPDPWQGKPGARILSVGSLKEVKNYRSLIEAAARLMQERAAVLAIVGEGELRGALREQADDLGVGDRTLLPGFTRTPGDWYRSADLFVLSSHYEGLPLVIVEAMHCGLPVVSTDCRHGPDEILEHGRLGRLVPVDDDAALSRAMGEALDTPSEPASLRQRAADFSVDRAVDGYWRMMFGS
ncbi:MAG: glycosyltransferase [Novosphingobium sp.]